MNLLAWKPGAFKAGIWKTGAWLGGATQPETPPIVTSRPAGLRDRRRPGVLPRFPHEEDEALLFGAIW
jgi:hypothetical protein